jgi:alpha/beta hydrolase family protein
VLIRLKIDRTEPFAEGQEFGTAGAYLRLAGTAYGEVDPRHPLNTVIVNLDKAPRNARGLVEYEVDFDIMRPADPGRGNRKILYEVVNRGRKNLLPVLHEAPETSPTSFNDPATATDAGNGFAFRAGYTLVWSGWDPDAPRANHGLSMRTPVATDKGAPIVKTIRDEFVFGTRVPTTRLTAPLSYEAATLDQGQARLSVRVREGDPDTEIPAHQWAYADARSIKLLPEGTAFQPGLIYDFWYPAKDPKVLGIGLAATRDLLSFLRYEARDRAGTANPVALNGGNPGVAAVLAFGVSQSGRYLRDHIALGFNQDETGRKVIDGVLSHVAGIGKVFANYEFGQPYRTRTQHEDHGFPENHFPFAHATLTDPVTGQTGGLWRGDGFDPLVIEVNTSTEYWQKGASLLHTDPQGQQDIAIPASVRHFLIAGTQHGGRSGMRAARGSGVHPRNPHDPTPALRALLVALDRWVTEGVEPPASRVPTVTTRTLVAPKDLSFPAIPEVQAPGFANRVDVMPDWVNPESRPASPYTPLVPQVDTDGNEVNGIRLPAIAVPLATHTGWNLYRAPYPEGELCDREGSYIPFARTKAERQANGDPRLSLEERYGNHEAYVQKVKEVVRELQKARLLLPEDAARFVDEAAGTDLFQA